jgi:putative SOS response-associated peptidase YedK
VIRTSPVELLKQLFDLASMPDVLPDRYNLAPRDPIPIIRVPHELELVRWGLTMKDPKHTGINAKMENLGRVYRDAIKDRRCLVITDGFFEWKTIGTKKYPFLIHRDDARPLVFAGIYDADGVAIITKPSEGVVKELHDRMPIVLEAGVHVRWLDRSTTDASDIMKAANANGLSMFPVSPDVNSVKNDRPDLIKRVPEPVVETPRQTSLF